MNFPPVESLTESANQGDVNAQNTLGHMYYTGSGVIQSVKWASYWFAKAAEQGDSYALNYLNHISCSATTQAYQSTPQPTTQAHQSTHQPTSQSTQQMVPQTKQLVNQHPAMLNRPKIPQASLVFAVIIWTILSIASMMYSYNIFGFYGMVQLFGAVILIPALAAGILAMILTIRAMKKIKQQRQYDIDFDIQIKPGFPGASVTFASILWLIFLARLNSSINVMALSPSSGFTFFIPVFIIGTCATALTLWAISKINLRRKYNIRFMLHRPKFPMVSAVFTAILWPISLIMLFSVSNDLYQSLSIGTNSSASIDVPGLNAYMFSYYSRLFQPALVVGIPAMILLFRVMSRLKLRHLYDKNSGQSDLYKHGNPIPSRIIAAILWIIYYITIQLAIQASIATNSIINPMYITPVYVAITAMLFSLNISRKST